MTEKKLSSSNREALAETPMPVQLVKITAKSKNLSYIVIGGSDVSAEEEHINGHVLYPGDSWACPINDLALIYGVALVSGDSIDIKKDEEIWEDEETKK